MHCDYLLIDGGKMSKSLGNAYLVTDLMEKIVEWYEAYLYGKDHENIMEKQINEFLALKE